MTLKVLFISLSGILVVFGFLFLLFLILSSFKYFFYNNKEINMEEGISIKSYVKKEELAVVLTAIRHHHQGELPGEKITIKKGGSKK